jgi:Na+/phosphate symporter
MLIPVLLIVVGVLIYALATNPKVAEIGRLMCAAGFFAIAFTFAGKGVTLP